MPSSNNHRPGSMGVVVGGFPLSNRGRFNAGWETDAVVLETDVVVGVGELVAVKDTWVMVEEEEGGEEDDRERGGDGERSRLFDLETGSVSPPFSLLLLLLFPSLLLF